MKYIGSIFGKDLMLDSDDEVIVKATVDYFERMKADQLELMELKMKMEIDEFKNEVRKPSMVKKWLALLV